MAILQTFKTVCVIIQINNTWIYCTVSLSTRKAPLNKIYYYNYCYIIIECVINKDGKKTETYFNNPPKTPLENKRIRMFVWLNYFNNAT